MSDGSASRSQTKRPFFSLNEPSACPPRPQTATTLAQNLSKENRHWFGYVYLLNMAIVIARAMKRCEACKVCIESKRPAEIDFVIVG